jgi:hypothetical protein
MSVRRLFSVLLLSGGIGLTTACAAGGDSTILEAGTGGDTGSPGHDGSADTGPAADSPPDTSFDTGAPPADVAPKSESSTVDGGKEAGMDVVSPSDSPTDTSTGSDAPTDTGSGTIPTTCAEADNAFGCCAGNVLYYCKTTTLASTTCSGTTPACGWETSKSYYNCVAAPGVADPGGTHPLACK